MANKRPTMNVTVEKFTTPDSAPEEKRVQVIDVNPVGVPRRLLMRRAYAGWRTAEKTILPGSYFEDDPFLHGHAEWFVEQGYGDWLR